MRFRKLIIKLLKRILWEIRLLLWQINCRFRQTLTISTRQGTYTVLTGKKDSIGQSLYCNRQYELDLISLAMAHLRQVEKIPPKGQGIIIDVGANIGVISIGMIVTGEVEKAIAIEPEPRNFSLLQQNVAQNGLSNSIICLPYAVSDKQSELLLEISNTNFGDNRIRHKTHRLSTQAHIREITVKGEKLDTLIANVPATFSQNITAVWVDVQGYEMLVFMGAQNLLTKGIPVITEFWPYGMQQAGISQEQYCHLAEKVWADYWVLRRTKFVRYPINTLPILFDEMDYNGGSTNIIFT